MCIRDRLLRLRAYVPVTHFVLNTRPAEMCIRDRRYTLRLLTLDQFQRAATLIAACELIRREDESTWGKEPFRIGLWVGQRSTPNWTKDAAEATKRSHGEWNGAAGRGTPYQLTHCPWCGQPIDPGKNIRVETPDEGRGRTFQYLSLIHI